MKKSVRETGEKGVGSVSANPCTWKFLGEVLVKANSDETIMSVGLFQSSFYQGHPLDEVAAAKEAFFNKC
jgi:hypothetical protein